jgi:hypothetical protein
MRSMFEFYDAKDRCFCREGRPMIPFQSFYLHFHSLAPPSWADEIRGTRDRRTGSQNQAKVQSNDSFGPHSFNVEVFMRIAKPLSTALVLAMMTASAVGAADYNRFGKGPTTIGLTPGGISTSGGNVSSRQSVQPAPVIATDPATDGQRAFSAEPSTVQPATPVVGPMTRRRANGPEYSRFGKGPTAIGLTPPGFGSTR